MRQTLGLLTAALLLGGTSLSAADNLPVRVEVLEGMPDKAAWNLDKVQVTERSSEQAFGIVAVPRRFSGKGLDLDRSSPFIIRATASVTLAAGEYRLLLRSRNAARLWLGDKLLTQTGFIKVGGSHESVPELPKVVEAGLRVLPVGHQEKLVILKLEEGAHEFRLEAVVGGQKLRPDVGELCVGIARSKGPFHLLGSTIALSDEDWAKYADASLARHQKRDADARGSAQIDEIKYWASRHELARRIAAERPAPAVPEVKRGTPVHNVIDRFIGSRLEAESIVPAPLTDDHTFLRRVTYDAIGLPPTPAEIAAFRADKSADRRAKVIDRLLADPRWADHWVSYWQDVLAENPAILKPTLNNTGPFRWWLHQALLDNQPMDRFASELLMMEGSIHGGGPAAFGVATENDAPMAAKALVLGKAFLGIDLQCARCHDAPFRPFKQHDVFSLAAMLRRDVQPLPLTSTVPMVEGGRKPAVEITLRPGTKVKPAWTLTGVAPGEFPDGLLRNPNDSRERLTVLLTSPRNDRFARVLVNRVWKRYLGIGFVEPVDDWDGTTPSHPELLDWLARELTTHDYDLKHIARLILNSHCYQRTVRREKSPDLFASPTRRRLSAEQLVDGLFHVAGKEFLCEELTLDPEGRQRWADMLHLGRPRRAWELCSLSNDRDRPALSLPVAQGLIDLLAAYGWRDSRPNPITVREETATPLQPLLLANGLVGSRITRLCDENAITELCVQEQPLPELIDAVYLRVLSRQASEKERRLFTGLLADGYEKRLVPGAVKRAKKRAPYLTAVSWANHLNAEATRIKQELERAVRAGDTPTERLQPEWRERMEDMVWALINSPEFVFVP